MVSAAAEVSTGIASWKELLKKCRALVFDFDGTLVDSVPIKRKAFDHCFEEFPAKKREIQSYCHGNNHTPRWEKFKFVYEQILRLPYTKEIEQKLLQRFERETTEQIARAPALPGAEEFLGAVRSRYRTALLSSTPHAILLQILKKRGWSGQFDEVQGAPVDKGVWLKSLERRGFSAKQILFLGDTPEDAAAAQEANCHFISVPELGDFRRLLGTL